jgi:hypothetical protein
LSPITVIPNRYNGQKSIPGFQGGNPSSLLVSKAQIRCPLAYRDSREAIPDDTGIPGRVLPGFQGGFTGIPGRVLPGFQGGFTGIPGREIALNP